MPKSKRKIGLQLGIYLLILSYVALDLLVMDGPLAELLRPWRPEVGLAEKGVVARVHKQPITQAELEHELSVYCYRRGLDLTKMPAEQVELLRSAVLLRLVDDHLLRVKVQFNSNDYPIDEARWKAEWQAWKARFASDLEMQNQLAKHGISEEEMRFRLAARQQQEAYLSQWLDERVSVSDEEVRDFYESNPEAFEVAEERKVRHLFAAALDHPGDEASSLIEEWSAQLRSGEETWQQAAAKSEDLNSGAQAGELGWLSADRLPDDFAEAVFSMEPGKPKLIVTELGSHWVEVMEIRPARVLELDEAKEAILRKLNLEKREEALREMRRVLRGKAIKDGQVIIFEHGVEP